MTQEIILIRGLPGSGKSTLARTICGFDPYEYQTIKWFETDMYFMQPKPESFFKPEEYDDPIDGKIECLKSGFWTNDFEYIFDGSKIKEAHIWCQDITRASLKKYQHCTCIVSNTFTRIWEMKPYIDMAKEFGAKLTVITCEGQHGNVHNVPPEKIQEMKARWEKYE